MTLETNAAMGYGQRVRSYWMFRFYDFIRLDEKRILPATAYLEGEYGISDLYMGVPVKLGAGGAEEIVKLKLTTGEKKMLKTSEAAVRDVVSVLTLS